MSPQRSLSIDDCPAPLMFVSAQGSILATNPELERLFGYGRGELDGESIEKLVPEAQRAAHVALRSGYLEAPSTRRMGSGRVLHGVSKSGEMIPIEVALDPKEIAGEPCIIVSVFDLRAQKRSEETLRRAIDAATSAMVQVDAEGAIELINARALELFGYAKEELLGQPVELLVPAQLRPGHVALRRGYGEARATRAMGEGRRLHGLRKDGTEIPIEVELTVVDGVGGGASTMATVLDLRSRLRFEDRIRSQADQLRRLNADLLQFAYSASHDLKAPLASVRGLLEICRLDLDDGETDDLGANLTECLGLADRLKDRVESLLALARAEGVDQDLAEVFPAQLIRSIWQAIGTGSITFRSRVDDGLSLRTQPARLESILENLIGNASKYVHGDRQPEILVAAEGQGASVILTVSDNGIGIPANDQAGIFSLFRRGHNARAGGAGMGLSLVERHVAHLEGTIQLASSPEGTTFTVTLPREPTGSAALPQESHR